MSNGEYLLLNGHSPFVFLLDLFKGLTQVGKQIFNVLGTDGKTDGRLCDALFCQFLVVELGVCRTGRVDD